MGVTKHPRCSQLILSRHIFPTHSSPTRSKRGTSATRRPQSAPSYARRTRSSSAPSRRPPYSTYGAAVGAAVTRSKEAYVHALNTLANTTASQTVSPGHYNRQYVSTGRPSPPRHTTPQEHAISRAAAKVMSSRVPVNNGRGFVPAGNSKSSFNVVAKGSKVARATTHFTAAVAAR